MGRANCTPTWGLARQVSSRCAEQGPRQWLEITMKSSSLAAVNVMHVGCLDETTKASQPPKPPGVHQVLRSRIPICHDCKRFAQGP